MMFKKEAIQIIKDIGPVGWAKTFTYGILLAVVYFSTLTWLVTRDWNREDYNYAYLIPLIVLYSGKKEGYCQKFHLYPLG